MLAYQKNKVMANAGHKLKSKIECSVLSQTRQSGSSTFLLHIQILNTETIFNGLINEPVMLWFRAGRYEQKFISLYFWLICGIWCIFLYFEFGLNK